MATAKERLLEAAATRFYAEGITATGIDAITREAGVARMSLYNNFSSKAELVDAYIEARHDEWLGLYRARVGEDATPQQRVLAVVDAYLDHARHAYPHGFRGCGLLNAAAELPVGSPGRGAVREHKEEVEHILSAALGALAAPDRAREVAEHLSFLVEGAVARAGLEGSPDRLERARELAARIVGDL
jgi:AcrR family transcriptional regulator